LLLLLLTSPLFPSAIPILLLHPRQTVLQTSLVFAFHCSSFELDVLIVAKRARVQSPLVFVIDQSGDCSRMHAD